MMQYKKLLVLVDSAQASAERLKAAINLARKSDADVCALFVMQIQIPAGVMAVGHGGWYMGGEMLAAARADAHATAEKVKQTSMQLVEQLDAKPVEWRQLEGDIVATVAKEAIYHDLVVIGKPDDTSKPRIHDDRTNGILMTCGKPCLLLPEAQPLSLRQPENVLVAWDESREAMRSVQAAMPFLSHARSVMVLSAYKHEERQETVAESNQRLIAYLASHGINATSHVINKSGRSTAECLVDYTELSDVDLIVMGAYGHSRLREFVLGGATLDMLHEATLPVLFAH